MRWLLILSLYVYALKAVKSYITKIGFKIYQVVSRRTLSEVCVIVGTLF